MSDKAVMTIYNYPVLLKLWCKMQGMLFFGYLSVGSSGILLSQPFSFFLSELLFRIALT
jgi:hypothetical protein